ncbi:MAG: NUDIX domain-containing protein [Gammaproteobacteria bacterium]|nr:NUDIX domain-containing protein [Gammaproteobacteria bacterium]
MYHYAHPHPAVTTDVVAFTIRKSMLNVLLIRRGNDPYRGCWALPGGFVDIDEDLEAGARRELEEETGVTGLDLEQFHAFGRPDRDPRERVISVAYYALVPPDNLRLHAASDADDAGWFPIDALPGLAFDHAEIIAMAHQRLVAGFDRSTIALRFLPDRFTLGELQSVHEAIRGQSLDRRNFRKWALTRGRIEATGELRHEGTHRPARLYRAVASARAGKID